MFLLDLPPAEPKAQSQMLTLAGSATPTALYVGARWIRRFHGMSYRHMGWLDRTPDMADIDVLDKYGLVQVHGMELNRIRLLLETYGPLLMNTRRPGGHAIVVNGYADSFNSRLFYRDPMSPERQQEIRYAELTERIRPGYPLLYVSCDGFPKPCSHVIDNRKITKF